MGESRSCIDGAGSGSSFICSTVCGILFGAEIDENIDRNESKDSSAVGSFMLRQYQDQPSLDVRCSPRVELSLCRFEANKYLGKDMLALLSSSEL